VEIAEKCSSPGCEQGSGTVVELRQLCLAHFISTSYGKLQELSQSTHTWTVGGTAWEFARDIIQDCVQTATHFSQAGSNLSNLERARLMDIAIWATELGRRLRRSPRSPKVIAIRLISEKPGNCWEEETYTLDISRHGARTKCQHKLKKDDTLKVLRLDTQEQVESRVVWHRPIKSGAQEVGIEFLHGGESISR
jgi:hypothetical protein